MEQTIAFPTDSERERDRQTVELRPFASYNSRTPRAPEAAIIVAVADDGAIGEDGRMPWHFSDDLKYFKAVTMGHPVIMGRNTWFSLPRRPLPGRRNIVVSRDPQFIPEGADKASSPEEALQMCASGEMPFIIGGGRLYEAMLPLVNKIYLTRVHATFPDADTRFPQIESEEWDEAPAVLPENVSCPEGVEFVVLHRRKG